MPKTEPVLIINTSNRSAFITFVCLCMMVVALGMFGVGVLLQLGAQLSPRLVASGLSMLKSGTILFLVFRLLILTRRVMRRLERRFATWPLFQIVMWLYALSKEMLVDFMQQLLWLLLR